MGILEEIVFGKGYIVIQANNIEILEDIQDQLIGFVSDHKKLEKVLSIGDLRKRLGKLSSNEINDVVLSLTSFSDLSSMLVRAFSDSVMELVGESIYLQRRSHIIFNISGFLDNTVSAHIDGMSGISPFSLILWTGSHDIDDDSGIWLWDQEKTMKYFQEQDKNKAVTGENVLNTDGKKPLKLKFGEAVVFNPFVLHGSIAHQNPLSRIGFSCRFQSRKHPLFIRNSEFYYPHQLQ